MGFQQSSDKPHEKDKEYTYVTYDTARAFLEEGFYSIEELEKVIEDIKEWNKLNKLNLDLIK